MPALPSLSFSLVLLPPSSRPDQVATLAQLLDRVSESALEAALGPALAVQSLLTPLLSASLLETLQGARGELDGLAPLCNSLTSSITNDSFNGGCRRGPCVWGVLLSLSVPGCQPSKMGVGCV
jgi:hypothetical protein